MGCGRGQYYSAYSFIVETTEQPANLGNQLTQKERGYIERKPTKHLLLVAIMSLACPCEHFCPVCFFPDIGVWVFCF